MKRSDRSKGKKQSNGAVVPRELTRATRTADIVSLPRRRCLAVDGAGSPKDAAFAQAIGALYAVSYTLKFARKKAGETDFKIGPLEGHWSAGLAAAPTHIEVYLNDPGRTRPEALRTVLLRELAAPRR